jgi:hypothetical protein
MLMLKRKMMLKMKMIIKVSGSIRKIIMALIGLLMKQEG